MASGKASKFVQMRVSLALHKKGVPCADSAIALFKTLLLLSHPAQLCNVHPVQMGSGRLFLDRHASGGMS